MSKPRFQFATVAKKTLKFLEGDVVKIVKETHLPIGTAYEVELLDQREIVLEQRLKDFRN